MSDQPTVFPIFITDGTRTVAILPTEALKVDMTGGTQTITGTVAMACDGTITVGGTVTAAPSI
jgi:hypothetical protein